ncbi:endoplasmic reticulum aminopeptidase 1-like [Asterias amurensis]|uniref:endoplasmic reticulum aminopeptidase 1-like n=1 Tax=Asterias amurensis TaxID=7602 RepID=UPI003AB77242
MEQEMAAAMSAGYRVLEEDPADQLDFQDSSSFRDDEGYLNPRIQSAGSHGGRIMRFSKERACTKRSAVLLLCVVLLAIFVIAVIASLARPQCMPPLQKPSVKVEATEETKTTSYSVATTSAATKEPTATVISVTTKSPAIATNGELFPWTDIRLPETTKPVHYELDMVTNLSNFKVTGSVNITFRCTTGVNSIVMHTKSMNLTSPERLQTLGGSAPAVTKMLIYEAHEQVYFEFSNALKPSTEYSIIISFSYKLSETLAGYYRSSYTEKGSQRFLATTQFEPTSARQAFPCFDEPQLKATFSMKMTRDKNLLSLFNTELLKTTLIDDNSEQDVFKTTVKMSTYLVAFVVCDFAKISNITSSGTNISVYTNPEKIGQAHLALDVLQKTIPFYESFFGVEYPLSKQDMIAIPDFSAGAMENWGLITYREASILYQEGVTSSGRKEWIVQTVTHELAHQWFGNLVTMEWWNDLWLNEGFASFVMFLGSDNYNKEWKMMDQFTVFTTQNALWVDSHGNSHPISVDVKDPSEINAIFDGISYDKGSAIIRMLKDYLPDNVFQKGLQSYLKKFQFSNANTNDLWNSISEVANDGAVGSLSDMMDTWTLQMGYPVVNLTRKGPQVCATQEHFLHSPNVKPSPDFPSPYNYRWIIPLTYFTSDAMSEKKTKLMDKSQTEVRFNLDINVRWIKANMNQSGFYRVNYDVDNWNALINQLKEDHTQLTAADRANLVDDAFSLAWADKLSHSIPLDMSLYLLKEHEYGPLSAAVSNLNKIGSVMRSTKGYSSFVAYMLKLLTPQIDHINQTGWDAETTHLGGFLKTTVLSSAVHLGHPETVEHTKTLFRKWKEHGTLVSADLRAIVYCSGIVHGTRDDWDFGWKKYNTTLAASEKTVLLRALSCTYDPFLINRYLHWSLDEDKISSQNTGTVIAAVAGNPAGAHAALTFVIENWDILIERYEDSPFEISQIIKSVTSRISRQFEYDQASQFFISHFNDSNTGKRAVQQALENMKSNILWLSTHEVEVTNWFEANTGS